MTPLRLIKGGLDEQIQENDLVARKISDSQINEVCYFNKGEILGLIQQIARKEGYTIHQLILDEEVHDMDGHLVSLTVKVEQERVLGSGWGNIWYQFVPKGISVDLGKKIMSNTTFIARMFAPVSDPKNPCLAGIVAEYQDKSWSIQPGQISDVAEKAVIETPVSQTRESIKEIIPS